MTPEIDVIFFFFRIKFHSFPSISFKKALIACGLRFEVRASVFFQPKKRPSIIVIMKYEIAPSYRDAR